MKIINFNVDKVQNQMQTLIDTTELSGSVLCSEEGLIIIDTFGYDSGTLYNTETISAMAASMISEHNYGYIPPDEIILSYQNEKIVIKKIYCEKKNLEFLLIAIIPINMRYFRRFVNKLVKLVNKNI